MAKKATKTPAKKAPSKRTKSPATGVTPSTQPTITPSTYEPDVGARITALEVQVQELRRQFIDLRDTIARGGGTGVVTLNCATVLQAARALSNKILTPLDELRRKINPAGIGTTDQQLRECLTQLMEEGKVYLQEMKSEFQVRIRTDIFGGFKA